MTDFLDRLRTIVGERGLITDAQGQHPYLTDWRDNYLGTALAIVRPATTEEVAAVVKLCAAEKIAIVPQGGNTGMVGGGTPDQSGHEIVLSLNRMNRILDVDEIGYSMTVEAGVVLKTIQETAAQHDRLFPLSPRRRGKLHHRRQPLDQCRRRAGPALRQCPPARARARGGDAAGRDLERPAGAQEGQYRLRPARSLSRRRRHLGHRHQGGAEALAQAQGRGDLVDRRAVARRRGGAV